MDNSFLLVMVAAMAGVAARNDLAGEEVHTTANCRW